jgi:SnoaL-like domain
MSPSDIDTLAERLFRALEDNDAATIESLCEPEARFSQNRNDPRMIAELLPGFAKLSERIGHHKYTEVRREVFDGGFVEEHRAVSTMPNGAPMAIWACVVGRVGASGKLVELHEYVDNAQRPGS